MFIGSALLAGGLILHVIQLTQHFKFLLLAQTNKKKKQKKNTHTHKKKKQTKKTKKQNKKKNKKKTELLHFCLNFPETVGSFN